MQRMKLPTVILLSALWISVSLNYIYCDLFSVMDSKMLNQYLTGTIEGIQLTEKFLFIAAIMMEVPLLMVVLSLVLPYKYNRWANMLAANFKTLVMVGSLFVGSNTLYYMFFAAVEVSITLMIFIIALRWKSDGIEPLLQAKAV